MNADVVPSFGATTPTPARGTISPTCMNANVASPFGEANQHLSTCVNADMTSPFPATVSLRGIYLAPVLLKWHLFFFFSLTTYFQAKEKKLSYVCINFFLYSPKIRYFSRK